MFYVLKTHNKDLTSFWGINAIAVFKTRKQAKDFCKAEMVKAEYNIKLIVVKAITAFKVTNINYDEVKL